MNEPIRISGGGAGYVIFIAVMVALIVLAFVWPALS